MKEYSDWCPTSQQYYCCKFYLVEISCLTPTNYKPRGNIWYDIITPCHHWFRLWILACMAPNHYLKNGDLLSMSSFGTKLSEIRIKIRIKLFINLTFSSTKLIWKFCRQNVDHLLHLNVLSNDYGNEVNWCILVNTGSSKKTQITGLMPTLVIFLMYSPECNFIVLWMIKLLLCMTSFKVILSKITSTYPRGHWVNYCHFVFSQMTSSWFWVPSPIIWLHGRCSSREVCSFALDDSGGGTSSIPKQPYLQWPTGYR